MIFWIKIGQLVIAVLLMLAILLQSKGTGLGGAFGGTGGGGGGVYLTKRGLEKKLFIATIVLAVIFLLLSLGAFLIKA